MTQTSACEVPDKLLESHNEESVRGKAGNFMKLFMSKVLELATRDKKLKRVHQEYEAVN